ncbi:MAG: ComEC/Rec2 family competence protein, partial [Planctomycetota bacterium]|nr:ComEC/Rec2 family competence protein [Planctomycetota bacterium]
MSGSVTGTICNLPVLRQRKYSSDRAPVKYADFSIREEGSNLPIRVEAEIATGQLPDDIKPGARVQVQGKLRFPTGPGMKTPYPPTIHSFANSLSFLPTTRDPHLPPVLQLRWKIISTISQLYSGRGLGFFQALIAGEKRSLDRQLHHDFLDTGTSHFLAISGLHVGLVMLFAMRIPFPRRIQLALRLLLLCGFALISGANTPVLRAALMIGLHMSLKAAARRPRPLDTLGWTLIILLAIDPSGLSQPGFQLSFIATAAILWWHSIRERESRRLQALAIPAQRFSKRKSPLASLAGMIGKGLSIGLVSTAATTPLIAEYFQRFHPLSPLLSLCLYPLVALSLILGLISVLLGIVSLPLGQLAAQPASLGAELLFELLCIFRTLPGHSYY